MARPTVKVKCTYCGNEFQKLKSEYNRKIKNNTTNFFCNLKCSGHYFDTKHLDKYRKIYSKNIKNYSNNRLDEFSSIKYYLNRCIYRSKKKGIKSDLTLEYLKDLWEKQNGICPYTGIKMELPRTTADEDVKKTPTKASLDQIIPSKGYIKGNVEFVCYSINVAKNDFSKEEMIDFINKIKKYT
jgi:hypothetical protein